MHFIDEAKIFLKSGNGGNGCVSFRREKFVARGGPNGGNGGRGASIVFVADSHMNTLLSFRYKQHFRAENGDSGKGSDMDGKSKSAMILKVPVGTQILDEGMNFVLCDFLEDGQEFEILRGGKGGIGNAHFKSSTNQSPTYAIPGEVTEEICVYLQLKLLADVGLVGLPNAGKSTFLAHVTNAKPKIADYPFSTVKPGLGVVKIEDNEFVLADIPGLIEGAHLGLGLGDRFLKHIERCKILIHLVDASSDDIVRDYQIIRNEISQYSEFLTDKLELLCLNKIDLISSEDLILKAKALEEFTGKKIFLISGATGENLKSVLYAAFSGIEQSDSDEQENSF
jgi:GTP-binding protein